MKSDISFDSLTLKSGTIKNLTVSILENPDMSNQFVVSPLEDFSPIINLILENAIPEEEDQDTTEEAAKSQVSRLEIEIKKNDFDLVPVVGQHFLLLLMASLQGRNLMEGGHLMMTNYRFIFFRDTIRRVDMPFGVIKDVEFDDKQQKVTFSLKYPHVWKFRIINSRKKYTFLKNFCPFYIKPAELKNNFAYQRFLKDKDRHPSNFDIFNQYIKLGFHEEKRVNQHNNQHFSIPSYPPLFYVLASLSNESVKTVSNYRKNGRIPLLAYLYHDSQSKAPVPLWISSSYEQKEIVKSIESQFLKDLAFGRKLEVFGVESKSMKGGEESIFWGEVNMNYLKLQSNQETRAAEMKLMEVLLYKKTPLILQIIGTGWYKYIGKILQSVAAIRNTLISQKAVLVRCQNGWDKSLTISSLVQLVLDPYFRTTEGFQMLVMRMFVQGGYPYASRLGERKSGKEMCPIFLQFLDCVSQLLNQNQTAFEFNFKYLSKLANLMQNNLYGTFIADSPQEYLECKVESQTISIWDDLKDETTLNGHYTRSNGFLSVAGSLDSSRLWKQYFCSLIYRKKDSYGYEPLAEDNDDYMNIFAVKLQRENEEMKKLVREQKKMIELLENQLAKQ